MDGDRNGGERVVGDAVRHFPDDVCGGGDDCQQIGFVCKIDVHRFPVGAEIEKVKQDRVSGDDLKLDRLHQAGSVFCHDHVH